MTNFANTEAGRAWIATGPSRETSREVMEAIAFFAADEAEANAIWEDGHGINLTDRDIWEHATENGTVDANLHWGAAGDSWSKKYDPKTAPFAIHVIVDESATMIGELVATASTFVEAKATARRESFYPFGVAIVRASDGAIDFGAGFDVPLADPGAPTPTYTVRSRTGEIIAAGVDLAEAAHTILTDDGWDYEIRGEPGEFWLWQRQQVANRPWARALVCSVADTQAHAEREIFAEVVAADDPRRPWAERDEA